MDCPSIESVPLKTPDTLRFGFENSYQRLPERFYARLPPVPVKNPKLIVLNHNLARDLHLDPAMLSSRGHAFFSGNVLPADAKPIALAYAGHQFGHFVPQLGDGRAILLGELIGSDNQRYDVQLKGSGQTPFSRQGDGRAWLGPVLREYLISEAMHALGIPTTRSLAVVTTGETIWREQRALPGAILTRVAASHIRVGTFQYFAARGDQNGIRILADHVIARHDPDLTHQERPYLALLASIAERQAALVAHWLLVGFIHGVMNTDNTAVSGETIDYGPCAFMDTYDPATVFSSIDQWGRYAYANQPEIAAWNLARLAETLLPLIDPDPDKAVSEANTVIESFAERFTSHWLNGMRAKMGLVLKEPEDISLAEDFLTLLHNAGADFTVSFRSLSRAIAEDPQVSETFGEHAAQFNTWATRWRSRLTREGRDPMQQEEQILSVNPAVIPRNHRVEVALKAAVDDGNLQPFQTLFDLLQKPYDIKAEQSDLAQPPAQPQRDYQTFCGT